MPFSSPARNFRPGRRRAALDELDAAAGPLVLVHDDRDRCAGRADLTGQGDGLVEPGPGDGPGGDLLREDPRDARRLQRAGLASQATGGRQLPGLVRHARGPARQLRAGPPGPARGLPRILTAQATGDSGLPERLRSSAFSNLWSSDPDPQTAVFLAVVAREAKAKITLGVDVTGHGKPLAYYFDTGCSSATAHSLRQDGELRARLGT